MLGDFYYFVDFCIDHVMLVLCECDNKYYIDDDYIFAPRLDQILAEIEKWGYEWIVISPNNKHLQYGVGLFKSLPLGDYWENTPKEAAAQALLWILKFDNS